MDKENDESIQEDKDDKAKWIEPEKVTDMKDAEESENEDIYEDDEGRREGFYERDAQETKSANKESSDGAEREEENDETSYQTAEEKSGNQSKSPEEDQESGDESANNNKEVSVKIEDDVDEFSENDEIFKEMSKILLIFFFFFRYSINIFKYGSLMREKRSEMALKILFSLVILMSNN